MCFSFTTIFHPQHPYSLRNSLRKLFVFCINAYECVRMSVYTLVLYKQLKQFKAIQHANYFIKALDYWYYQNITFKQRFNSSPVFFLHWEFCGYYSFMPLKCSKFIQCYFHMQQCRFYREYLKWLKKKGFLMEIYFKITQWIWKQHNTHYSQSGSFVCGTHFRNIQTPNFSFRSSCIIYLFAVWNF